MNMTTRINAYLAFDGNCEEAMNFYKDCLGGKLTLNRVEGSPMEEQATPEMKNKILHADLIKGDLVLMASDMICTNEAFQHGNSISLSLNCDSEQEIRTFFEHLSAGAQATEPLQEQFWGAIFGMITDKYGVKWLLNYDLIQKN